MLPQARFPRETISLCWDALSPVDGVGRLVLSASTSSHINRCHVGTSIHRRTLYPARRVTAVAAYPVGSRATYCVLYRRTIERRAAALMKEKIPKQNKTNVVPEKDYKATANKKHREDTSSRHLWFISYGKRTLAIERTTPTDSDCCRPPTSSALGNKADKSRAKQLLLLLFSHIN